MCAKKARCLASQPIQEHISLCDAVNATQEQAYTERNQKQSKYGTGGQKMATEQRLIDANALLLEIEKELADYCTFFSAEQNKMINVGLRIAATDTRNQPTVDAVPVVHGHWIDSISVGHMGRITGYSIDCSVCDSVFKDDSRAVVKHWKEQFKVCPFCGAVMGLNGE